MVISSKLKRRNRARVELPRILEKKGLIVVDLLSEYPPFIVPDIIKLDEPDLWIHEFVEASLWELLPNCARAHSLIGSRQMSPDEFWTMTSQFYENIKQKTSAEAHLLTTHDHTKGMLKARALLIMPHNREN